MRRTALANPALTENDSGLIGGNVGALWLCWALDSLCPVRGERSSCNRVTIPLRPLIHPRDRRHFKADICLFTCRGMSSFERSENKENSRQQKDGTYTAISWNIWKTASWGAIESTQFRSISVKQSSLRKNVVNSWLPRFRKTAKPGNPHS